MYKHQGWSEEEIELIRNNYDLSAHVLADKLGRSVSSVYHARRRIKNKIFDRNTSEKLEWDERPSGWYVEIIGVLLVECPDAFESWLHFHGYQEVKQLGPVRCSEVTLLCRRESK
jgi:hypothetical protein